MSKPSHIQTPTKIKEMLLTEIKKVLYKEKPVAIVAGKGDTYYKYKTFCSLGIIEFRVPISDMSDKLFDDKIQGQLLIRWLIA